MAAEKRSKLELIDLVLHRKGCTQSDWDLEEMRRLYCDCPELIDYPDDSGNTSLYNAVNARHLKCINFLLTRGANPNLGKYRDKNNESTPLTALTGEVLDPKLDDQIITLLLNNGANPNCYGMTTYAGYNLPPFLGHVISKCSPAVLALCLAKGADPNTKIRYSERNYTTELPCIAVATIQGKHEMVNLLLKYKANVNIVGNIEVT